MSYQTFAGSSLINFLVALHNQIETYRTLKWRLTQIVTESEKNTGYNHEVMNGSYFESLNNQFLVAMPKLEDPGFSRTVTLICQHDSNGAMGIIINRTIESLSVNDVLNQCSLPKASSTSVGLQPIHDGGPVHPELGLVLHRNAEKWDSTLDISNDLHLTSSRDALEAIGKKSESRNYLLVLGYAGWGAGQLDFELKQNSWLTVPADPRIIFDVSIEKRWLEAITFLGIDVANLSASGGHA